MSTVLVTGAARGIGKAITAHLATLGWDVIAGVRSSADAAALGAIPGVSPVLLDVTNDEHVAALDTALPARLDAVVNNAGVVVGGPLETVKPVDLRRQFDVNVVGQLAVTQAVLPRLRDSRGRIVFISSVNGRISSPMIGAYCASKFALEAAADALRMELKPWHIDVSIVEPAQTDTDMWETAPQMVEDVEASMAAEQRVLYAKHVAGMKKMIPMSQRIAVPAEKVAEVVAEALTARRPHVRYGVGLATTVQMAVLHNTPSAVSDVVLRKMFGQP
jgi:NAD(P)-dependent dehydrogenase (short-subunit alcohol dehydrogenase family)